MNVMDVTRTKTMTIEFSFRNQINRMLDILRWVSLLFTKSRNEGLVTSKHILFSAEPAPAVDKHCIQLFRKIANQPHVVKSLYNCNKIVLEWDHLKLVFLS